MPTINISVIVPSDVVDAVTAWRLRQTTDDGQGGQALKYSGNVALLEAIIKDKVQDILDQEPTVIIQGHLDDIEVAKAAIIVEKDQCVT